MLSFWERESFVSFDHLVIGGGIVGLSTAIELKTLYPKARIGVLERGVFPSGASTKNAGFACFGSLTEVLSDLGKMTDDQVLALVERRWEGLHLLRTRLGDAAIDYQNFGGYELLRTPEELAALDQIDKVNALLKPIFEKPVYEPVMQQLPDLGFDPTTVKGLVFNPFEGQIHTGKMMNALQHFALQMGVELFTGSQVKAFEEKRTEVEVQLENGTLLKAAQLAICTNAFTKGLVVAGELEPGRGVVVVTQPITDLKFKGTFHYDEGFYYFRNYENRVIFGGGRNLDMEGETTTTFGVPEVILDKLKQDLSELILPDTPHEIDMVWSGIMGFGATKQPILKQQSSRVFLGVRLGGMGVAIGSILGKELAQLMQGCK